MMIKSGLFYWTVTQKSANLSIIWHWLYHWMKQNYLIFHMLQHI